MSVFKSHGCPVCHGASGAGDTAMGKKNNIPDYRSAAVQSQTDEQLVKTIREGKGPVSASAHKSKALTADQAKAVVAWIRSLK
jgi:mono/diheme cytochrome c family protein